MIVVLMPEFIHKRGKGKVKVERIFDNPPFFKRLPINRISGVNKELLPV